MILVAALLGLCVPLGAAAALVHAAGLDAVGAVGLLACSTAVNALWPLGGGMVVDGTWRVRFGRWERSYDGRRGLGEGLLGPFALGAATLLGVVVPLPAVLLFAGELFAPGPAQELEALGALAAMVLVALARHRPEVPLARWRAEALACASLAPERWRPRLEAIARITGLDGAVGNTGGIGARTAGLHEHLDAVELLGRLRTAGLDRAEVMLARALAHLERRRERDGFQLYPGALPRPELSRRAEQALRADSEG